MALETDAEAERGAEAGAERVAADWERCRIESSEGFRRRSWLLEARWPGVWDRGIGGVRSCASLVSSESAAGAGGRASTGDVEGAAILCDRTTLSFWGEDRARSRAGAPWAGPGPPLAAAWSAIVGSYDHFSESRTSTHGQRGALRGEGVGGSSDVDQFGDQLVVVWSRRASTEGAKGRSGTVALPDSKENKHTGTNRGRANRRGEQVKAKDDEARRPGSDKSQSQSQKETSDVDEVNGGVLVVR